MAVFSGPEVINNGLVLHLDASNSRSYPGSGTAWSDLSGNGNNGLLTNGPAFSNTLKKFSFDSVNDFVSVNTLTNVDFITTFTIECVFKQLGASNPGPIVEKYNWAVANKGGWGLRFMGGNLGFFTGVQSNSELTQIGYNLATNLIHHVSVTFSNGITAIYVNGNTVKTHTFSLLPATTVGMPLYLAQRGDNSGAFNNIEIYKTKLYNRALTATEIKQNFEATRSRYGI